MGQLEPGGEQVEESIRERDRVRPQSGGVAVGGGGGRLRLHQRQLLRRLPQAERVRGDAGSARRHVRRLLEDGVGDQELLHRDDDAARGARAHQVRPVLAVEGRRDVRRRHGHRRRRPATRHLLHQEFPPHKGMWLVLSAIFHGELTRLI